MKLQLYNESYSIVRGYYSKKYNLIKKRKFEEKILFVFSFSTNASHSYNTESFLLKYIFFLVIIILRYFLE